MGRLVCLAIKGEDAHGTGAPGAINLSGAQFREHNPANVQFHAELLVEAVMFASGPGGDKRALAEIADIFVQAAEYRTDEFLVVFNAPGRCGGAVQVERS